MSTTLTSVPAAGWYPDPADAGNWRWWDGAAWTDHVQVKATEPITAPQVVAPAAPEPATPAPATPVVPEPTAPYAEWVAQSPPPVPPAAAPVPANPAPAEPAPAYAPTPHLPGANAVPQPGTLVTAPNVPVSMTPETPISDQMYWHSSAAEVIEVPRHHGSTSSSIGPGARGGGNLPRYVVDWNDIGSPNTAGVWLLAVMPVLMPALGFLAGFAMGVTGLNEPATVQTVVLALVALGYLLMWIAAGLDIRALRERGYRPPRIWWMLLLPPLAYLIARGKSVRRESRRAWPPELVYVLGVVVTGAGYVLINGLPAVG